MNGASRRAWGLLCGLALALPLGAAELQGVVMDYGHPVQGAEVLAVATDGVVLGREVTDHRGRFWFKVPAGRYELGVFLEQYAPVWKKGLEVGEGGRVVELEITPDPFGDGEQVPSGDCD